MPLQVVFGAFMSPNQIACTSPDFSHFSIGLPHKVFVEVSLNKGRSWTNNKVPLILYGVRTSTDALGFPMWGYEDTFTKASWQVRHLPCCIDTPPQSHATVGLSLLQKRL